MLDQPVVIFTSESSMVSPMRLTETLARLGVFISLMIPANKEQAIYESCE